MKKKTIYRAVPFAKAARVGNFKLWRSKYVKKTSDGHVGIECVHVSDLDGAWSVRIPETYEMFGIIMSLYNDATDELNIVLSAQARTIIEKIVGNMMYASVIGNGYYHRALTLVTTIYANPHLLSEDEREGLLEEVTHLKDDFLEWRKGYDALTEQMEPTEEDDHREALAEEAIDILNEKGES